MSRKSRSTFRLGEPQFTPRPLTRSLTRLYGPSGPNGFDFSQETVVATPRVPASTSGISAAGHISSTPAQHSQSPSAFSAPALSSAPRGTVNVHAPTAQQGDLLNMGQAQVDAMGF